MREPISSGGEISTAYLGLVETRRARRIALSWWSSAAAVLVTAVAFCVLAGWAFDVESLKFVLPGRIAMNPATAVGFLLCALSLQLSIDRAEGASTRIKLRCAKAGALLIIALGVLKLAGILFQFDSGVDRWLFASKLGSAPGAVNAMAPNTALSFMLIGCAFLFLHAKRPRVRAWACLFAMVTAFEGLLVILGHVYAVQSLAGVGSFIPMALHSAICFLLVAVGIIVWQARRGVLAVITAPNGAGAMVRRLLPAAVLVPAVIGWLRLEGQRLGFYDNEFGTALYTVTVMLAFSGVICCNGVSLFRAESKRAKAERRLQRALARTEVRVEERTAELLATNAALEAARSELEAHVRERSARLAETQSMLQSILDHASSIIYVKDLNGRFLVINRQMSSFLGLAESEIIGRTGHDLYPNSANAFRANDKVALAAGRPVEFEEMFPGPDGPHIFISSKFPLRDSHGEIHALGCVSTDITSHKRSEQALRQAEVEATRANRAKSEFLSRMSHELRTPMNAILGFAQLLELEELSQEQQEGVRHILRGGRHLLDLINEVLDISRIEAGRLSLSLEPVDLNETLQESIELVQPLASKREIRILAPPGCACFVLGDRQRLKQVLINLLSNGVKYNRLGGTVTVFCESREERVRVSVTDTGLGIPAEKQSQLFVPFERLGAEQSTIEGTGLGLALAKRLVEAMNGTLGLESTIGQGSNFWIELPTSKLPVPEPDAVETPHNHHLMPHNERNVLYIEDNLSNIRLAERLLDRRPGAKLIVANTGAAGLQIARQQHPDLLLLDLNLPDMHGSDVLQQLHSEEETAHIPVIVLSADATARQIARLKEAGVFDYLTKPLNVKKFYEVLDAALAQKL